MKTRDGSPTLYNEAYEEHYHSTAGALRETVEKYIKPCRIRSLAQSGHLSVLDVGFGLGYNAIAAIDAALDENPQAEVHIISLEKDPHILKKSIKAPLNHYDILQHLSHDPIRNQYTYEDKNIYLQILIGDARDTIKEIKEKVDAVFLDPFSPRKNPELWTTEFFGAIASRMKPDAVLATYSCARQVRENLKKAGFWIKDGPRVGRRGPSTIAGKK